MNSPITVFYSNRSSALYQELKKNLFVKGQPFARKLIIVPSAAMKSWLMLQLANDPDIGIAAGLKILEIDHAMLAETLPSSTELALFIEAELRTSVTKESIYEPLVAYLQLSDKELRGEAFSSRSNRRIVTLATELSSLFQRYGKYGEKLLINWKKESANDWQHHLWKKVYEKWGLKILYESLHQTLPEVHLFCMSHVCRIYHQLLTHQKATYYIVSPCQHFWSDLTRFDRESHGLLANLGRLGREMALQIELSEAISYERYKVTDAALKFTEYEEYFLGDEQFEKSETPLNLENAVQGDELTQDLNLESLLIDADSSQREKAAPLKSDDGLKDCVNLSSSTVFSRLSVLEAIQTDMLLMRKDSQLSLNEDDSLQIYAAVSPLREVQILHDRLLDICQKGDVKPGDICVMAPNIRDYEPYLQMVFKSGPFQFQLNDGNFISQSQLIQSFMCLINLPFGRWDAPSMLKLFESPRFQKKQGLKACDVSLIRSWIKEARITWGADVQHRHDLLRQNFSDKGISDENPAGTWEVGFQRLVCGLAVEDVESIFPISCVDTTEMELLGKWILLMRSLRRDLSPIVSGTELTVQEWAEYLLELLETYFSKEGLSEADEAVEELLKSFCAFSGEEKFPFSTIHHHLETKLEKKNAPFREHDLNAVRFSSLLPMCTIPAKVIALIGMQEGKYPRKEKFHPLDRLGKEGDYIPTQVDHDRYLFLEGLLSAKNNLLISYNTNGGLYLPSLLISELVHYCDQNYVIEGKKASEFLLKEYPEAPYDPICFTKNSVCKSYSEFHYQLARAHLEKKKPKHCFIPSFEKKPAPISTHYHVTLDQLKAFAKNPIRSYFRHSLGFSIREEQEEILASEPFSLSALEKYQIRKEALVAPFNQVLHRAEKEGRIPFGAFKAWTVDRLKGEIQEADRILSNLGIAPEDYLDIELSEKEDTLIMDGNKWKLPALQVECKADLHVTLTGHFEDVTRLGLAVNLKDDRVDVLKAWPLLLVLSCLREEHALPIEQQLIFLKAGKFKVPFFTEPRKLLSHYLNYYVESLHRISPLIPEFVPDLLSKDAQGLTKSMNDKLNGNFHTLYNAELLWALRGGVLPESETLLKDWKEVANELYSQLYTHWYSK